MLLSAECDCAGRRRCGGKQRAEKLEILEAPESRPARNAGLVGFAFYGNRKRMKEKSAGKTMTGASILWELH